MRIIQRIRFDHCTITYADYAGSLHMGPHTDEESRISIILNGSLLEKTEKGCAEAKRNSVVIKPNSAIHENIFGHKGVSLLSISFKKDYPLPDGLLNWQWFEDPRVSFSTYKLWFSVKSVKNDKELNRQLDMFIETMQAFKKTQHHSSPCWLIAAEQSLTRYFVNDERIENIAEKVGVSRGHMSRSFKKHHSISPVKYRQYARMNDLMYNLLSTTKSLAEIAYECGFSDQSQMARIVLKETGYTANNLRAILQKT